jgi:hypothetical protein
MQTLSRRAVMAITTSESINKNKKISESDPKDPSGKTAAARENAARSDQKAEMKDESAVPKRVGDKAEPQPYVETTESGGNERPEGDLDDGDTRKYLAKQEKVKVYIPRARGTQTVQINGVDFRVPAGVETEVPADVAALLRGSRVMDLPPEV